MSDSTRPERQAVLFVKRLVLAAALAPSLASFGELRGQPAADGKLKVSAQILGEKLGAAYGSDFGRWLAPLKAGGKSPASSRKGPKASDGAGAGEPGVLCSDCLRGELDCGITTQGQLSAGDCAFQDGSLFDVYQLDLAESRLVEINMESAQFDSVVVLFDGTCQPIIANDDCIAQDISRSCLAVPLAAGTYFVVATSFGPAQGSYTVVANCSENTLCRDCRGGDIACGDSGGGVLGSGVCQFAERFIDVYPFTVAQSSRVGITLMTGGAFDAMLYVLDADCNLIALNDDCAPNDTSRSCISGQLEAGTYHLAVSSFNSGETGNYQISTSCANLCVDCVAGDLACGKSIAGSLAAEDCLLPDDGSFIDLYRVEVAETSTVRVSITSAAFDTFVFVFDSQCNVIGVNDDCFDGTLDSCIAGDLPPGTYFVGVNSFEPGMMGAYQVSVTCAAGTLCDQCPPSPIECAKPIQGSLSAKDCTLATDGSSLDLYRLELPEAGEVALSLTSTAFDTFLFVFDESCAVIAQNDDCTEGDLNSCLRMTLPAGVYHIAANSFSSGQFGDYTLTAGCPAPPPCERCRAGSVVCGEPFTGNYPASGCAPGGTPYDALEFELAEAATVTFTLESAAFDPKLILRDGACERMAENDDCVDSVASCITVDLAAGRYSLGITTLFPEQTGAYTLTARCAAPGGLQQPGDCNQDGTLNIADASCLFGYLFLGAPEALPCGNGAVDDAANVALEDWNGDTVINIADGVSKLNYLFLGGPTHELGEVCVPIVGCRERCP
jgi:hypothetical protein